VSLDEGDNDLSRFLTYLVAALQTIVPNIGEGVSGVLQSPQPPPTESILTTLLNEITTLPNNYVLILDDYHVIDSRPVDAALSFLLEQPASSVSPGHHNPRGTILAPGSIVRSEPIDRIARR
jgi:LuxR family transcriptional regulator, maltose regulon positive regulatory protein